MHKNALAATTRLRTLRITAFSTPLDFGEKDEKRKLRVEKGKGQKRRARGEKEERDKEAKEGNQ